MKLQVQKIASDDRAAWLEERGKDFTASHAGALFGVHTYQTLRSIALEKVTGAKVDKGSPALYRRGHVMEPAVAKAMEIDHGLKVEWASDYLRGRIEGRPNMRVGATKDYHLRCTPEELARACDLPEQWKGLPSLSLAVECKSVDYKVFQDRWSKGPPLEHVAQVGMQAWLAGDDGGLVAALVMSFGLELVVYAVPRSEVFEVELARRVEEFWSRVEAGDPQPHDVRDGAKALFPDADPAQTADLSGDVRASDDLAAAAQRLREAAADLAGWLPEEALTSWAGRLGLREAGGAVAKAAAAVSEVVEEDLRLAVGEAEAAAVPGWKVTWKNRKDGPRVLLVRREKPAKEKR